MDYGFVGYGGKGEIIVEMISKLKKGGHLIVHGPDDEDVLE